MKVLEITNLKLRADNDLFHDFFLQHTEQVGSKMAFWWAIRISVCHSMEWKNILLFLTTGQWIVKISLLSLLVSDFGSSDWPQCQPFLPHITKLKTLCPGCATNLCSLLEEKKTTTHLRKDTTAPTLFIDCFFVYSLICICKTLPGYLLSSWQPENKSQVEI